MTKILKVAIMQPTYLPWPGYFSLMDAVDIFVFLDDVQFNKRSWQQRNKIKTLKGAHWLSFPVLSKGKHDQIISDVELVDEFENKEKHLKTIQNNYSKTPYFKNIFQKIEQVFEVEHKLLINLNIAVIKLIQEELKIESKFLLSSNLNNKGKKDNKIHSICKDLGATDYYSPTGSFDYMEKSNLFKQSNIKVQYFNFHPAQYMQIHGEFIPYLTTLDLLFNNLHNARDYIKCKKNISISKG